ncbi:MAG: phage tail tape measure protein [Paracoccaceae bacterium]
MTDYQASLDALDANLGDLEATIGATQAVSAAFQGELKAMQVTLSSAGQQVDSLTRSIGWGLRRAFDGLVFDGKSLTEVLRNLGLSMANSVFTQALMPIQNALAGVLVSGVENMVSSLLPFQNGAPFSQGKVTPFAQGGVFSRPTGFAMRGGLGLLGEAGPEAIMPLARGRDGKLGIRSEGGARPVNVTMNITTPDVSGFRRSRTQIAAQMSRAMARASRNS